MSFLKKIKVELPYYPTIPLMDMYPKEFKSGVWIDIHTTMFTVELFIIAKGEKQHFCNIMHKEICLYAYGNIILSRLKDKYMIPFKLKLRLSKSINTDSRILSVTGRKKSGDLLFNGMRWIVVMAAPQYNCT